MKSKSDRPKVSKIAASPDFVVLKKVEEFKKRVISLEEGMLVLQDSTNKLLQLSNDTSTNMLKMHVPIDGIKQKRVKIFNRLFKQVHSIKSEANSSNNEFVVLFHTSYFKFSKYMECSYERFFHNMHNTLTYFLKKLRLSSQTTLFSKGACPLSSPFLTVLRELFCHCLNCMILHSP